MWPLFFAKFPILCYLMFFSLLDSSLPAALSFPFVVCHRLPVPWHWVGKLRRCFLEDYTKEIANIFAFPSLSWFWGQQGTCHSSQAETIPGPGQPTALDWRVAWRARAGKMTQVHTAPWSPTWLPAESWWEFNRYLPFQGVHREYEETRTIGRKEEV